MAKHFQHEIDWTAKHSASSPAEQALEGQELSPIPASIATDERRCKGQADDWSREWDGCSMPNPTALLEAVGRAVFGVDDYGNVNPSPEEVAEITEHHTDRLVELLERSQDIDDRLANTYGGSRKSLVRQRDQVHSAYLGALALYAEDFGEEASRHLDAWARHQLESGSADVLEDARMPRPPSYEPGHPWHYYREGDAAKPIPADEIEPASDCDWSFAGSLPKNAAKRNEKLRTLLDDQRRQLAEDKARYQDLIDRGADALSEYDRTIAHGGNIELAWASAVALKYNHIRYGLGRVAWLHGQMQR